MNGDQYYVLWPDGQKFGPADLSTLQRWVAENRVGPATLLENASNGHHIRASDLPALQSVLTPTMPMGGPNPAGGPYAQPGPYGSSAPYGQPVQGPYPAPGGFVPSNPAAGTAEVTISWVLGAFGLLCCGVLAGAAGLIMGVIAHSKGQKNAMAAIIFNIVVIFLGVIIGAFFSLATGF